MDSKELLQLIFTALEAERKELNKQTEEFYEIHKRNIFSDLSGKLESAMEAFDSMKTTIHLSDGILRAELIVEKIANENGLC